MKKGSLSMFRGVNSAFNPRQIKEFFAVHSSNAYVENGELGPRPGYKNLRLPQSGFSAVLGVDYIQGYNSGTEKEEYISVETVSGNTRAFSNDASTASATELTNGGGAVNLHASEWVTQAFREYAYLINPNNTSPVYRHEINTNNSLTAVAIPADPTVAPAYVVKYGGGSTPYTQMSYLDIDVTTEVAYTGAAHSTDSSVASDGSIIIGHGASNIESSFEIDFNGATAGVQDYTYNDKFAFTLNTLDNGFRVDHTTMRVQFSNNDGSPKTLIPDYIEVQRTVSGGQERYLVQFGWTDKTRADFDNVRKMKVTYNKGADSGASRLQMSPMWEGGIDMTQPASERLPGTAGLFLAYTYYFSTPQFESGLSPVLFIPNSVLQGYSPGADIDPLGVHIEVTATVSGDSNVDNFRFYVQDNSAQVFRRLATQSDADATYDVRLTFPEIIRLDEFSPGPFTFAKVTNMFSHKGSVAWLYDTEFQNVRFSRVGDPLRQASDEDSDEDLNRGATFSLADNFADKPLGGVSVGDAAMIAGKTGVYFSLGDYPAQMTPFRKTSGSFGVAGKRAFARWKDDSGLTGMVYVSPNGQVYFAVPGNGQNDGDNICISEAIRDGESSLKSWLLDGQASLGFTDYSTVQVKINERDDTLVIVMGQRGLKLRRPDLTGQRSWEPCDWNTGSDTAKISYLAASSKYGIRWIRSTGHFDEDEYDNANRQYIGGVNRDGGNPMPKGFWKSKVLDGANRRVFRIYLHRSMLHEEGRVRVHSKRLTQWYKFPAGKLFLNCMPLQQGFDHQFEIEVPEMMGKITLFEWYEGGLGERFNL